MATPRQSLARTSLVRHLSELTDPRKASLCDHLFLDVLLMALMVILCGAEAWDEIHDWASSKEPMLRKMLTLPNGIPSADTSRRVFARLRPYAFERAFRGWIDEMIDTHGARWIAIDGKTVRGEALWRRSSRDPLAALSCDPPAVAGSRPRVVAAAGS